VQVRACFSEATRFRELPACNSRAIAGLRSSARGPFRRARHSGCRVRRGPVLLARDDLVRADLGDAEALGRASGRLAPTSVGTRAAARAGSGRRRDAPSQVRSMAPRDRSGQRSGQRGGQGQRDGSPSSDPVDERDASPPTSPSTSSSEVAQVSGIEPRFVRIDDVHQYTAISTRQLRELTRTKRIPHMHVGSNIHYDLLAITQWMIAQTCGLTFDSARSPTWPCSQCPWAQSEAHGLPDSPSPRPRPTKAQPTKAQPAKAQPTTAQPGSPGISRSRRQPPAGDPAAQFGLVAQSRRVVRKRREQGDVT